KLVAWLFFDGGGEMFQATGLIALCASQPSGPHVVGCLVAVFRRHLFQGFSGRIELIETQRGRSKVELAVEIVRPEPSDLSAPGNRFEQVLLLGRLGQNVERRERIGMKLKNFLCVRGRAAEIL